MRTKLRTNNLDARVKKRKRYEDTFAIKVISIKGISM